MGQGLTRSSGGTLPYHAPCVCEWVGVVKSCLRSHNRSCPVSDSHLLFTLKTARQGADQPQKKRKSRYACTPPPPKHKKNLNLTNESKEIECQGQGQRRLVPVHRLLIKLHCMLRNNRNNTCRRRTTGVRACAAAGRVGARGPRVDRRPWRERAS